MIASCEHWNHNSMAIAKTCMFMLTGSIESSYLIQVNSFKPCISRTNFILIDTCPCLNITTIMNENEPYVINALTQLLYLKNKFVNSILMKAKSFYVV